MFRRALSYAFLATVMLVSPALAAARDAIPEDAVIAANWDEILRRLAAARASDPVALILAGHAFLATDRTNEAVCSFAAGAPAEAREAWRAWTSTFVLEHASSAIAHYLAGDALARNEDFSAAIGEFGQGLALSPGDPLILNARAVAEAGSGDWGAAKADLITAEAEAKGPIYVELNRAVLAILHRDDAAFAGRLFEDVTKRDPTNLIALVGRGAVAAVDREWRTARRFYKEATSITGCVPLALDDLLLMQDAEIKMNRATVTSNVASTTPGALILRKPEPSVRNDLATTEANLVRTAATLSALDQAGLLTPRQLDSPNDQMARLAMARTVKNIGTTIGDGGSTIGGAMLWMALKDPEVKSKFTLGAGGIATIFVSRSAQDGFNTIANNILRQPTLQSVSARPAPLSSDIGGLSSQPPKQAWDDGEWPLVVWPALLYTVKPVSPSREAQRK
jgi:tetratricopeptide (TPR) repeat protein